MDILDNMKSYVHRTYLSDHLPIILQWRIDNISWGIPVKFNRVWLEDKDYNDLVNTTCAETKWHLEDFAMRALTHKLNIIKIQSRTWEIKKKL